MLKSLSDKLEKHEIKQLLEKIEGLSESFDKRLADSVLEVAIRVNKETVEELIGDESMYEALMEIMEPRIKQREDAKIEEERKKGIQITVKSLRDFGVGKEDIRKVIIKNYGLSESDVDAYL